MLSEKYNTIRFKISFIVGVITITYSLILVGYLNYNYKSSKINDAIEISKVYAQNYATEIKSQIEQALDISRTTAQILSCRQNLENPLLLNRKDASEIIKNLVSKNKFLLGMYTAWEPNAFDNNDNAYAGLPNNHPDGHFVPYWYRDNQSNTIAFEPLKYYLVPGKGDYYLLPRKTKQETVIDPISYKIGEKQVLLMTLVVPILTNKANFLGVVGTDISSESILNLIKSKLIFEGNGKVNIISNNGTIVASSYNDSISGKQMADILPEIKDKINNLNGINSYTENDELTTIVPIKFGSTANTWYVVIKTPIEYLIKDLNTELIKLTGFAILFFIILLLVTNYFITKFLKPIFKITRVAQKVAIGNLEVWDVESSTVEIEKLNTAFKKVIDSQKDIAEVTTSISNGDYSKKAIIKSEKDILAISVNKMIENLKSTTEEEQKRKWTNEGYANFAELLRHNESLNNSSFSALKFLIQYLNANQGGVFLVEKTDRIYLELKASYAYDRQKFNQKTIEIGEGLVGQCFVEKEMLLLNDLPKNYISITSGLGFANPNYIILLPIMYNESIEGVIEIATFHTFESHQIEFLKRCVNLFASVVSNIKTNDLTTSLLANAQNQTESMKIQENVMRQNMEELTALQEQMTRKETEYIEKIEQLMKKINN
ncbi:MAG: hypothetical protein EAZ53_06035 [Bacteroidetes bacterium]|nr:MAG: hypothetical protein EAZ53_06035 [Bacteroidota bacterium]